MEEEYETNHKPIAYALLLIQSIIIGLCVLFFVGVTKVDAADFTTIGIREQSVDGNVNNYTNITNETYPTWDNNYDVNGLSRRRYIVYLTYNFKKENMYSFNMEFESIILYWYGVMNWGNNSVSLYWYDGSNESPLSCNVTGTAQVNTNSTQVTKNYNYLVSCNNIQPTKDMQQVRIKFAYPSASGSPKPIMDRQAFSVVAKPSLNFQQTIDTGAITSNADANANNIINNQNENTDIIIQNFYNNTQDIINNNNNNTQEIIEAGKVCSNKQIQYTNETNNKYLNINGQEISIASGNITNYIELENNKEYTIEKQDWSGSSRTYCLYDANKNKTTCNYMQSTKVIINSGNNKYLRFSTIPNENMKLYGYVCQNGNQAVNDSLDDLNKNLTDDSIDTSKISGFTVNGADGGISSIITAPLSAIQGILNNTCVDIVAPIPFTNKNFTMPCLTPVYEDHFPSILNIWQVVVTGIIAYWICLNLFHMVHGFTDPTDDKIEVVDL